MRSSPKVFWSLSCRGKCSVTLLNETDILSQYLEKEVSKRYWEKREGSGHCPQRQEERKSAMRYKLTDCLFWELRVYPTAPCL